MGLHLADKLTSAHIDWRKNIMKVKMAAQTLSSSTADAIQFLRTLEESYIDPGRESIPKARIKH